MREATQIGLQGTRARVVLSGGGQWSVANGVLEFCDECAVAELGWALIEMGSGKWCLYTVRSGTIIELHQRDTWSFDHDSGGIMINWIANRADGGLAVFRIYRATFRRAVLYICANRTGEGLSAGDFLVKLYRLVAGDSADPSWISIDIFLKICYDFPRVKSSLGLNLENKEQEISDLYQAVHECKECPLYRLAKNPVPGAGSANAQIMFIGEGPGEKEDELGLPFVGAAGKLLDEMLKSIDLKREDVYIANVVKHRPPGNRDPKPEEVAACWPYLQKQIDIIKPKLIVCLGRHSLGRFLPNVGPISAVHGRCFVRKNQAYMALYHPAVGLYNGGMRETLFKDFAKIKVALKKIDIDK